MLPLLNFYGLKPLEIPMRPDGMDLSILARAIWKERPALVYTMPNFHYGPVRSRRLGRSLGINLLPPGKKWCTFDCLYCQYGLTNGAQSGAGENKQAVPSLENVVLAMDAALRELDGPPAYLTFSGNGEPTLHPDFPRLCRPCVN